MFILREGSKRAIAWNFSVPVTLQHYRNAMHRYFGKKIFKLAQFNNQNVSPAEKGFEVLLL